MSGLSTTEEKMREEIVSIREERRANRLRSYLEVVRTIFIAIGAVIVFWAVQRPESIINQSSSQESISRERARLILEWLREPDSNKRLQALSVIKAAYGPSNDSWLVNVEREARADAVTQDIQNLKLLEQQRKKKESEMRAEEFGLNGNAGKGRNYFLLGAELQEIEAQYQATKQRLRKNGFELTEN